MVNRNEAVLLRIKNISRREESEIVEACSIELFANIQLPRLLNTLVRNL